MNRAVVSLLLLFLASPALAHSWYPPDCCSGRDCRPVAADDLVEIGNGCWRYLPEKIDFCGNRVRPSQDRYWHVCISPAGLPYCAFIQMGF